jgi:ribose transport system substrate-binding protein
VDHGGFGSAPRRRVSRVILGVAIVALVGGCSSGATTAPSAPSNATAAPGASATSAAAATLPLDNKTLQPDALISSGPDGSPPALASSVDLTQEECDKVKAGNYKVAIAMQTMEITWAQVQVKSITKQLAKCGVSVLAVTDGKWKADVQTADLENLVVLKPDGIVTNPVDEIATAPAYKRVAAAGILLVFLDQAPRALEYGKEYASAVGSDNQGNGAIAAHALAELIPQGGTVGMVNFQNILWAAERRSEGFKDWMAANRPDIIIKETTFTDANKVAQLATDFVTANPEIAGMYGVYDGIGLEILAGMRAMGKEMPISTIDLGELAAVEIAKGGIIATGAQRVADQGTAEANAMMKALLKQTTPKYIMVPSLAVTPANLTEAYGIVFGEPAPADLIKLCGDHAGCK